MKTVKCLFSFLIYFILCCGATFGNTKVEYSKANNYNSIALNLKYHKVIKIGTSLSEAKTNFCQGITTENISWKLNILVEEPLDKSQIYKIDFGRGLHYYKILLASTTQGDPDYEIITNQQYIPIHPDCELDNDNDGLNNARDFCPDIAGPTSNRGCPLLGSKKYHKVIYMGHDARTANDNDCNGTTPGNTNSFYKLNITRTSPLIKGKIYRLKILNNGWYYYKVVLASNESGDGDDLIPGNIIDTPLQKFCDPDHDGINSSSDNCPNDYNPDQEDFDNDGKGDACDTIDNRDNDNDGIDNYADDCPNESGPASNNGCPIVGNEDLQFEELNKSDFRSDCYAPGTGCAISGHYIHKSVFSNGMDFKVSVRNIGDARSQTAYIHVYLWADDDPNVAFYKPSNNVFKLDPLNPGQNRPFISFYFDDKGSFFNGARLPAGNYTLQIRIEQTLQGNSEFSTDVKIPFQVRAGDPPSRSLSFTKENRVPNSYKVFIYNIQGLLLNQKTVLTKDEEDKFINSLPKGFYIVKNGTETYKIVKE
ncbi:thrombospondin type 3 repeat-containing protein [Aquimarina aggregata]|uniref:thrombospondin type 3 repeat-containing protein n=1 Tax=Aquimarina aggregata TaxID=1642818 RepID=UPI002492D19D|nr:thrombospondin type 3 repeat-containing protein [Aquimarina aggregata]